MRSKFWLWPNIIGIDAALIAVAWQWIFATNSQAPLTLSAQLVLGFSVWLSYMADRLYDVRRRPIEQLLSLRHRFVKSYRKQLWCIWFVALGLNISIALLGLTVEQLRNGSILLAACLLYTFLNQAYSKYFFPKELFVALIFTAGAVVFLESLPNHLAVCCFALIGFINCLIIGHKEQAVDRALRVESLSSVISTKALWGLIIGACLILPFIGTIMALSFSLTLLATSLLYRFRRLLTSEVFRTALDASMLFGLLPWIF
ncbi:MAG: hypothetical protein ABF315_01205 [Lentimonas sp.]